MLDLTKYELKPIYINGVFDHYGLVPKKPLNTDENPSKSTPFNKLKESK